MAQVGPSMLVTDGLPFTAGQLLTLQASSILPTLASSTTTSATPSGCTSISSQRIPRLPVRNTSSWIGIGDHVLYTTLASG